MLIKECREKLSLTQEQMVGVLKTVCPKMDVSLLSKMENGLCEPTHDVTEYVQKVLASCCNEQKDDVEATYPQRLKKLLNQGLYSSVYRQLKTTNRSHPVTRQQLVQNTGFSDRRIRQAISELRNEGLPIISSSSHYGYWLARSEVEERMLILEYKHRAYELLRTASALEKSSVGQMEMSW